MTNPSTRRAAVHHPSLSSPLVRVSSQQHLSFNPHSLTFSPSSPSIFLRQALMAASKRFTSRVWAEFVNNAGHDANCFGHLKVLDAKPGWVKAGMKVERHQVNRLGSLHGGVIASLVDTLGSLSLSTRGMWMTGVSTDINVTYVRAAMLGEEVLLRGEVVGMGKTLAYTRIELTSAKSGKLLAFGSHTKFIQLALKSPENIRLSEDGERELAEGEEVGAK